MSGKTPKRRNLTPILVAILISRGGIANGETAYFSASNPASEPYRTVVSLPYASTLPAEGKYLSGNIFEPCAGISNEPTYINVPLPKRLSPVTFSLPAGLGFSVTPEDINYTYLEIIEADYFSSSYDVLAFPNAQFSYQFFQTLGRDFEFTDQVLRDLKHPLRAAALQCGYDARKYGLHRVLWQNTLDRFDGLGDGLVRQYTLQYDGSIGGMIRPNAPSLITIGGYIVFSIFAGSDHDILTALEGSANYWIAAKSIGLTWQDALFLEELHNRGQVCHPGRISLQCQEVMQWTYEDYLTKVEKLVEDLQRAAAFYRHVQQKNTELTAFLDNFQSLYLGTFRDVDGLSYVNPNHWNSNVEQEPASSAIIDRLNAMRTYAPDTPQWGQWSQGNSISALSDRYMPIANQKDLLSQAKNLASKWREHEAPAESILGDHTDESDYQRDMRFASEVFSDCLSHIVSSGEVSQENLQAIRRVITMQSTDRYFGNVLVKPPLSFRQKYMSADCRIVASLSVEDDISSYLSPDLGKKILAPMPTGVSMLLQKIRRIATERDRYEESLELGFGLRGAITAHLATLAREQQTFLYLELPVNRLIRDFYKSRAVEQSHGRTYEQLLPPIAVISNTGDSLRYPIVEEAVAYPGRDERSAILTSEQKFLVSFFLDAAEYRNAEEFMSRAAIESEYLEVSLSESPMLCPILVSRFEFEPSQRKVTLLLAQSQACRDGLEFNLPYTRFIDAGEKYVGEPDADGAVNFVVPESQRLVSLLKDLPTQFRVRFEY